METRHTYFYEKRKHGKFRLVECPDTSFPVADTHCHLEMSEDPAWLLHRCNVHNVKFLACVIDSTDDGPDALQKILYLEGTEVCLPGGGTELDEKQEGTEVDLPGVIDKSPGKSTSVPEKPEKCRVRYIVGTHPHHAEKWDDAQVANFRDMLKNPKVACVGEIGLDYHYDLSPRDAQLKVFEEQLKIAKEVGLPVALHIREAHEDALKVIEKVGWNEKGTLLHCCTVGPEEVKPWVEAGCYVAFGGALTFKKLEEVREAAKLIPADRLLTETDAPFMTPEPMRGMECYPDHVIFTAQKLYEIAGAEMDKKDFYAQIYQNALDFFGA